MRSNFVRAIVFGILRLALFAALVALGIVFVPDAFMDRVAYGVDTAVVFLQGETAKRAPAIARDVTQQVNDTKVDAGNIYQSFKEKYYPAVSEWIAGLFGYKAK